jgi:hypothetical protein
MMKTWQGRILSVSINDDLTFDEKYIWLIEAKSLIECAYEMSKNGACFETSKYELVNELIQKAFKIGEFIGIEVFKNHSYLLSAFGNRKY